MPRRMALLVATYRYQDSGLRQLTAPGHDAEALAEVLRHPEIAGFDVTILVNEPHYVVGRAIGDFYRNRRRDDLTLLYFTGHGLEDDDGRLYLAMTNTTRDDLLFTALSAQQIDYAMDSSLSRQKVLMLDCCYSGAFPADHIFKADAEVHALEKFQGKGRVVLTASDATQYSFEGNHIVGQGSRSVFTRFLVEGLSTGEADLDSDGDISLDELYSYVHDRVIDEMPQQRPKKQENIEGRIIIARNIHWRLPAYIHNAVESTFAQDRVAALERLAHLHRIGNDLVRAEVINQTRRLIHDSSKPVSAAAMELMATLNPEQAQQEIEKRLEIEKRIVTLPTLSIPVDNTNARNGQLGLEARAELAPPGTAAKNQALPGWRDVRERAQRKAGRWIALSSWSKPVPRSYQKKAQPQGQRQDAITTQDGEHFRLAGIRDLTRLVHHQIVVAASAALVIISLVVVPVVVTSRLVSAIPPASPHHMTTPPQPMTAPPHHMTTPPPPPAAPPQPTTPPPPPTALPSPMTAPPHHMTAPPPPPAAPPQPTTTPPPPRAAPPQPTTTPSPSATATHPRPECFPFCDESPPSDQEKRGG